MQAATAILCLEGQKLIVLFTDDISSAAVDKIRAQPPTEEHLRGASKEFKGQVVVLGPGQGIFVRPGIWHAAINLACTISINSTMCAVDDVVCMLHASYEWVHRHEKFGLFGNGLFSIMSIALAYDCQAVQDAFQRYKACALVSVDACVRAQQWARLLSLLHQHPGTFAHGCKGKLKTLEKQLLQHMPYVDMMTAHTRV